MEKVQQTTDKVSDDSKDLGDEKVSGSAEEPFQLVDFDSENQCWDNQYALKNALKSSQFALESDDYILTHAQRRRYPIQHVWETNTNECDLNRVFEYFKVYWPNRDDFLTIFRAVHEEKSLSDAKRITVPIAPGDKWFQCVSQPGDLHTQGIQTLQASQASHNSDNKHVKTSYIDIVNQQRLQSPSHSPPQSPSPFELDNTHNTHNNTRNVHNPTAESQNTKEFLSKWLPCRVPGCRNKRYLRPFPKPGADPYFLRCSTCARPQGSCCAIPGCFRYTTRSVKTGKLHKYCHIHRPIK
jgi:hypothetical protein